MNLREESSQEDLKTKLRENNRAIEIYFTKTDGTERLMFATLNPKLIPNDRFPEGNSSTLRKESPDALRVYDTEKQAWRSFRWDSVYKIILITETQDTYITLTFSCPNTKEIDIHTEI